MINDCYGSLAAMTSTRSITGGSARRSAACAINAAAIGPARCACRPDSSGNASKMPNVDGPSRRPNQAVVAGSACANESPLRRNASTAASFPVFAFNRTNNATVTMLFTFLNVPALGAGRANHLDGLHLEGRHAVHAVAVRAGDGHLVTHVLAQVHAGRGSGEGKRR